MSRSRCRACACFLLFAQLLPCGGCTAWRGAPTGVTTDLAQAPERVVGIPSPESTETPETTEQRVEPVHGVVREMPTAYVIGAEDQLDVSVYSDKDLDKTQSVRPDGKIELPLIGDVKASGLTPDELRAEITQRLSKYVRNPSVTVVVAAYKSKRVSVLGEVQYPGVIPLSADITLLEGISKAGGVTSNADLQSALLVRGGRVLPVNFEKLLREGEVAQNDVQLQSSDVILIPNVNARKVFVLGEVNRPLVAALKYPISLVELIAMAGGFTRDAERKNVIVVRGGLAEPKLFKIDVESIVTEGKEDRNLALQAGDIVYAPRSLIGDVDRFFQHLSTILQPIVLASTAVVLGPEFAALLRTSSSVSTPVIVPP